MQFSDIRTMTLNWLDDVNGTYFTPAMVNQWINNAQKETQKLLLQSNQNWYVKPVQTTLVVNQSDYVMPQDFLKEHRIEIVVSGSPPNEDVVPLAPITVNQQDLVPNHTGQPQWYFYKRNRFTLFPCPDTALTLRLYYSYEVVDMVLDTDIPDVPVQYHEFLAVLATIDGLLRDGRDVTAFIEKRLYYEKMLKEDAQERNQDAPRSIVQTGEGAGYTFGYF